MYKSENICKTNSYTVHIAGDYDVAVQFTREFTFKHGSCAELTKVDYCYTGGLEAGLTARFICYPRFPKDDETIHKEVYMYSVQLAEKLCQKSFTIEGLENTHYYLSDNPLHKK